MRHHHLLVATGVLMALQSLPARSTAAARPKLEVQGHRGARARFPENSLPAFTHALQVGADVLELDLVVTADDQLAVIHDPVVKREHCRPLAGARLPDPFVVRQHSMAELKRFDCGAMSHPRFPDQQLLPGTRVPTLDEVVALVRSSKTPAAARIRFNLEAKSVPGRPEQTVAPQRFAALVVEALRRHKLIDRAVLQSFDHRVLRAAHKIEPRLTTAVLVDGSLPDLVAVARAAHAEIVSPNQYWITRIEVEAIHRAGLRVIPWTANSPVEWQRLIDLGVDGIITDDPEALIAYLKGR